MGDGYTESETMYTMNATERHAVCVENHPNDSRVKISEDGTVQTLSSRMGTGGGNVPMVMEQDIKTYQHVTGALTPGAHPGSYNGQDAYNDMLIASVYGVSSFGAYKEGTTSLRAQGGDNGGGSENIAVQNAIVRRLTPLECERLQGFPDHWTDIGDWVDSKGKKHKGESDSPRYKALGNSIALPFWQWMAERMVKYVDEQTMGSLFDGIGGFPLVFSRCGCTPVWASEIEEFPIAVTKIRFPE
jgi:DNA (cytosine-5)-methyltransferase 1